MKEQPEKNSFTGPLFIVGISRSGTKLLRDLLNNHSRVALPANESKFIPGLYKKNRIYGDLKDKKNFAAFFKDISGTIFFQRVSEKGRAIEKEAWYRSIKEWTFAGAVETLLRIAVPGEPKPIWGDKSPNYLIHIPLLKKLFPGTKFIHIIRDVRDVCLSARKAWGRNIYFSAQRWTNRIKQCRTDARQYTENDYYEVKYEDLITCPEKMVKALCGFIGIQYEENMCQLKQPAEEVGDARDKAAIVKNNSGKWQTAMTAKQVERIEKISGALLGELGYPVSYRGKTVKLNPIEMNLYKWLGFIRVFVSEVKDRGISRAPGIFFKTITSRPRFFLFGRRRNYNLPGEQEQIKGGDK